MLDMPMAGMTALLSYIPTAAVSNNLMCTWWVANVHMQVADALLASM